MTTPEDTELLERLASAAANFELVDGTSSQNLLDEAAATIRRLQHELAAVRKHRDDFKRGAIDLQEQKQALQSQLSDARELLGELANAVEAEVNEKGGGGYILARLSDAREHLSCTKPTPETEEA